MLSILSIKASKIQNRVWITFSDSSFIPFFIDDVVKLSLTRNQEIDESKFQLIIQTCLLFTGREYALRQIAISPKTEKIISHKLRIFFQKIILRYKIKVNNINLNEISQQITQYLKDRKLLNQTDFVSYFVKKNSKKSRQQIIFMLQQLGVDKDSLSSITINPKGDIDKIKTFLDKKKIDKSKLADFNEKNKIKASLFRRGFNISDINNAIDDLMNFR